MATAPQPVSIQDFLEQGKPFEVKFEGGALSISEAKGVSKISLSADEIKNAKIRKAAKRKVLKGHKEFLTNASEILIRERVPFKVTFGTEESVLRFDLDHYIRLFRDKEDRNPDKCLVMGFNNLEEMPVALIREHLSVYPNVKLLVPKR
jgi:hypothetical protein